KAILFQAFWAVILVFTGSFDTLTDLLVMVAFIFYGAGAFGVFVLRKKMKEVPRTYKVPFYPLIPALFVVFSLFLVCTTIYNDYKSAITGLGLVALGLPFYFWQNRTKTLR
ncbi:MAG: amino acid permease, partial [Bacteroidia bacterium]|nr:amino acid permease [Bacteroidia bacterium]